MSGKGTSRVPHQVGTGRRCESVLQGGSVSVHDLSTEERVTSIYENI